MVVHASDVSRDVWVDRKRSSSTFHNTVLNQSAVDLLQIAATVCHAKLAVLYLDDRPALTSEPGDPLDHFEIDSVAVADGGSHLGGRLAVLDGERRALTQSERGLLVKIAAQITRFIEIDHEQSLASAIVDKSSDVIVILDHDGWRSYVSSAVERMLGYKPEELIGENHFALVHDDDREAIVNAFSQLIAGPPPVQLASYRFKRKDGAWRVLEAMATNLTQSLVGGVLLNLRDITDRNRVEQERGQLQQLSSLGRMAGHVAHEFNNVLMGIQPVADIIRRRSGDDAQLLRSAEMISASIARGKRLTSDILRFGKPAELALKPVDVQQLVRIVADEVRPMLREDINFRVGLSEAPLYAVADAAQLSRVLLNLALNARDALETKRGGSLEISVSPGEKLDTSSGDGDEFIHVAISDTGQGINAADLPYIFEPFFTTRRGASGIGLSIVFQIVTAHHGYVRVDTKPGAGTTFHVFVPVSAEPPLDIDRDPEDASFEPGGELPRSG